MNKSLTILHLILSELGIDQDIRSIEERMTLQKAVYLGQISGIDLGYRYGWYYKGPYCSSLADDYYSLDRIDPASKNPNNLELNDNVKERLSNIRPLLEVPDNVTLAKSSWLELLASLHFLTVVSGLSEHDAETKIQTSKPHVFRYIEEAKTALRTYNLLA